MKSTLFWHGCWNWAPSPGGFEPPLGHARGITLSISIPAFPSSSLVRIAPLAPSFLSANGIQSDSKGFIFPCCEHI